MLSGLKNNVLGTWSNIRGWRTSERLVVLESDDWGSIRVPSLEAIAAMRRKGVPLGDSLFDELDCLESGGDLELLFDLLASHTDSKRQAAIMTLYTVMGNPDFDAIRDDQFVNFHHELMFDSYRRYHDRDLRNLWNSGMDAGLIRPQFHAREHLNSTLWLRDLRAGRKHTRVAFDYGFYGVRSGTSSAVQQNYLAAYWAESTDDLDRIGKILEDGLRLFEATFGFASSTLTPCNYVWPVELERMLGNLGVTMIQSQRGQPIPQLQDGGRLLARRRYTGQANGLGQRYSVRNVSFEPYNDKSADWVGLALREIQRAFLFRKPAVVSTHRINYTGGIDIKHRDRCLRMLDDLLVQIHQKWPDVQFVSSDELSARMQRDS